MKSLPTPDPSAPAAPLIAATAPSVTEATPVPDVLYRARAFAQPLLSGAMLDTGENIMAHADAVAAILHAIGGSEVMQAASYLVYTSEHLNKPYDSLSKAFGESLANLAMETTKLVRLQRMSRLAHDAAGAAAAAPMAQSAAAQTESVRKMLLAFSRDLRVVMLRLASRLQTLRHYAATKLPVPLSLASEALQVFAPLANRLGIWEIKWEMEDLAFRFLEPQTYKQVAKLLDEKRTEREALVENLRQQLVTDLAAQGIAAMVQGRPKHIYSIVKKMRGKSLGFEQVYDISALRIVVANVADCYAALSWVHSRFAPIASEFDDYIARPKANGYQSLHTVVRDAQGRPIEVQLRTHAMHDHAEHGIAAHWAYKEAGTKGYAGVSASGEYDSKIAVLRQLLAWERELTRADPTAAQATPSAPVLDDRIYVLTPSAAIVELPQGATAVDFAYSVHTDLGHRCRGAKADGVMLSLHTPLKNGQTIEIIAAKEGGPSRDWLNPELGFLVSHRARAKVRAWFNALALDATIARGREAVEKLLQREGKSAVKLDDLAAQLGQASAQALFEAVGKDELSLHSIEVVLRPAEPSPSIYETWQSKKSRFSSTPSKSGLLVVGVDSLMTQLSKCCKPAPPDAIVGFVTRGKGVSVHRLDCTNVRNLLQHNAERTIEVAWGQASAQTGGVYLVDVLVEASDHAHLLRDVLEFFSKEKIKVVGVQTQSIKGIAWMTLTIEVNDAGRIPQLLSSVLDVRGVRSARRR